MQKASYQTTSTHTKPPRLRLMFILLLMIISGAKPVSFNMALHVNINTAQVESQQTDKKTEAKVE